MFTPMIPCGFTGFFDFAAEGAEVGFKGIAGHIGLFHPNHGSGDDADAAFVGHGGSEPGKRNTNAHAALTIGVLAMRSPMFRVGKDMKNLLEVSYGVMGTQAE